MPPFDTKSNKSQLPVIVRKPQPCKEPLRANPLQDIVREPKPYKGPDNLTILPDSLLIATARFLPVKDQKILRGVNRSMRDVTNDNQLSHANFQRFFPQRAKALPYHANIDYKKLSIQTVRGEYQFLSARLKSLYDAVKVYDAATDSDITEFKKHFENPEDLYAYDKSGIRIIDYIRKNSSQQFLTDCYHLIKGKYTLNQKVDPFKTDKNGANIMYWAILCRQPLKEVQSLGILGCKYTSPANSEHSPLCLAAQDGNIPLARYLFDKFASDCNYEDMPVHIAINFLQFDFAKFLIEEDHYELFRLTPQCESVIHSAVKAGNVDFLNYLLRYGNALPLIKQIHVDRLNLYGETATNLAAQKGNLAMLQALFDNKAALIRRRSTLPREQQEQEFGDEQNEATEVATIDPIDASVIAPNKKPVHDAAEHGHLPVIEFLIEKNNDDVDAVCLQGLRPLHYAAINGHLAVVKYLAENPRKRANVNVRSSHNVTALHIASAVGHLDIVKCLVENGADINLKTASSNGVSSISAFSYAAQYNHAEVVQYLLSRPDLDHEEVQNTLAKIKTYPNCASAIIVMAQAKLEKYLAQVNTRADNHYKTSLTFFGLFTICNFGYSAGQKKKAAQALKDALACKGEPDKKLFAEHRGALNNGDLQEIYSLVARYI